MDLAVNAVKTVYRKEENNVEIDTKRDDKIEKISSGLLKDCAKLDLSLKHI